MRGMCHAEAVEKGGNASVGDGSKRWKLRIAHGVTPEVIPLNLGWALEINDGFNALPMPKYTALSWDTGKGCFYGREWESVLNLSQISAVLHLGTRGD